MRIVLVANLHHPTSGGLRTAVDRLAGGYVQRGHAVAVVVPGPRTDGDPAAVADGTVTRLALGAPRVPGSGGYRLMDPWRVRRLLEQLTPDRIEVSDRTTLRGLGRWAAERGVPTLVLAHERLDRLLTQFLLPPAAARRVADAANRRTARGHDLVVCSTGFAAEEFARLGAPVAQVPLGVDLRTFAPDRFDARLRSEPHETFGLAGLEAMACGTPVVASASSALRELVAGGRHGAAVPDDASAFADGVQQVLALPVEVRREAARARAADFPWSAAVDRMLDLLAA